MSRTRLAAVLIPLVITSAGAAFAGTPAAGGAGRVEPNGKAMRVVFESGDGAVELQVADKGAVVSGLVV